MRDWLAWRVCFLICHPLSMQPVYSACFDLKSSRSTGCAFSVCADVARALSCHCPGPLLADRLAASSSLDAHAPFAVGVPSWLRDSSDPTPGHNYFFMHINPAAPSKGKGPYLIGAGAPESTTVQGVLSDHMPDKADLAAQLLGKQQQPSGLAYGPQMLHKSPVPDLVLGPLLGKGGYGKVFRGLHKGQEVAVKVGCFSGAGEGRGVEGPGKGGGGWG